MANRTIKGTFTRNAWEFYEYADSWMFGFIEPSTGSPGIGFKNNSTGNGQLDVFRVESDCSVAAPMQWVILAPGYTVTAFTPFNINQANLQLDLGMPTGAPFAFSAITSNLFARLRQRNENVNFDALELANGGPFVTLPPGYAIAVTWTISSFAIITMSAWYQIILDQIPPGGAQ